MKKLILILLVSIIYSGTSFSQNVEGKADDAARISITPTVKDNSIPKSAQKMLINKMKQICTLNGMAGDGKNPYFTMDASVDVLSKEITPTAPPMHAVNLSINLSISDKDGKVYSQTSVEVKGVGKNETKAYIQGIKHINTRKGQFKAFIEQGKTKIIEYYNSNCDFFISTAKTLNAQGFNNDAIRVLYSVPTVCKECYDKCMDLAAQIEPTKDEAVAPLPGSDETQASTTSESGKSIEIDKNIFLVFKGSKEFGNKLVLYFQIENHGSKDYELNDYYGNARIIDQNGTEKKVVERILAGKSGSYVIATVIPGTPTKLEYYFDMVDQVKMFEYKYKNSTFRMKDFSLSSPSASKDANLGDNTGSVKSVTESDWSKFGSLPDSKVVYKKVFKWGTCKLPIDNLGNFSWESAIQVEGKVTRFQYTLPSDNNSEYVLKIYKGLLSAANYKILVSLGNDEASRENPGYNYYTYLQNDKFGNKYGCRYNYSNSVFLVTKTHVGNEDVYFVFFIMEREEATVITQDIIEVPK